MPTAVFISNTQAVTVDLHMTSDLRGPQAMDLNQEPTQTHAYTKTHVQNNKYRAHMKYTYMLTTYISHKHTT